ncbi:MAG: polysaccharide pyruvyl transferase family protein [Gammaproteobacteria bacterium]|nr:polysaccharide pyruvyl transferase family protein [Gammaproteobacteria bacterium]
MTKIAVISYKTLNVGDEIQSLATKKLLERLGHTVNLTIDREELNSFHAEEKVKLICNGWFMEQPEHWPPSDSIEPLFISMHLSHESDSAKFLTDKKLLSYYKKFAPIGCRDYHTLRTLVKAGIPAYYSGCMTFTFENEYKERSNHIVFADPFYRLRPLNYEKYIAEKLIPEDERKNIVWVTHKRQSRNLLQEERVRNTEELIKLYATAKLVITSRMHAALTCLALETPVIFVDSGYERKSSRNRFAGLIDNVPLLESDALPFAKRSIFHYMARVLKLYKFSKKLKHLDIDWDNPPKSASDISQLAAGLRKSVADFVPVHPQ